MPTILDEFSLPKAGTFNKVEFEPSVDQGLGESILEILKSFNIEGKIVGTETGPIVTSVYFAPASGVRVSSVEERADDLQIRLGVPSLKISMAAEKRAVAIEIPNTKPCKIQFGNVFHSDCSHMQLPAALGVDTKGNSVYLDITKTPHMLIAGQTGSGKSVCLNSIIVSLALNCRPADLQFLLIDPKRVEFFPYEKMHNLVSGHVIKDVDEALQSLMWLVQEMEARNVILEKCRCRNIKDFKRKLNLGQIEDMPIPFTQDMPYIVAVVDEYADLMMRSPKELVDCIMKLAQKARNVGIHLILATQRPSTKIISGDIKANIPARIALKTATAVDSSTILGFGGAEKLLGKGDMLLSTDGPVKRIHGCYISDEEIEKAISLLPTRDMFHFNRKDLFLTDFELFWNERFKERPTWGEINAVSKAALEHINDYLDNKEIEVNQGIAKEELTNIWQELEKAVKNGELCELIAKRFLPQMPIAESEFTKLVIYTNFYFKDSEAIHPFMKFILEKAVKESDKTALMTVKHFSSSACYDRNILQKEIKTMCDNNEMSKEFIYEHFADFKSVIVDWAKEGDERAETILFGNYKDYEEFKEALIERAYRSNEKARDFVIQNAADFSKSVVSWAKGDAEHIFKDAPNHKFVIVDWAIAGIQNAKKYICNQNKNYDGFRYRLAYLVQEGNKKATDFIITNYPYFDFIFFQQLKTFDGLDNIVLDKVKERISANNNDKEAKDFFLSHQKAVDGIYNQPLLHKEIIINWANCKNDDKAKQCIYDNYNNFKDIIHKEIIINWADCKNDDKAKQCIYDNYNDFKETIIAWANNGDENSAFFIYNNFFNFKDIIIKWANSKKDDKAKQCIYDNYNNFKETIIAWATDKDDDKAKESIYQNPNHFKDVIIDWITAKNDEKARETVYNHPGDFLEIIMKWANNSDTKAIESIYRNPSLFKDVITNWANNSDERAREIIYNYPDDFQSVIIDWANGGDERAKNIAFEFINVNGCDEKSEIRFVYDHPNEFKDLIIDWACSGDDEAEEFIYDNLDIFSETIIKWANDSDERAKKTIYNNPEDFKETIINWADNGDVWAKKIAFIITNNYGINIVNAEGFVYDHPSEFKNLIINWACGDWDDESKKIIYDNYDTFSDTIIEWANDGDESARETIYKYPNFFNETIMGWAYNSDEYAADFIINHLDDFKETITEHANKGDERARETIYNHPDKFKNLIIGWSNNGNEEATDFIYDNFDIFDDTITKWANEGDERAQKKLADEKAASELFFRQIRETIRKEKQGNVVDAIIRQTPNMQQKPTASETEDNNSIDFEPFKETNKMSIDEYLNHLLNDYDEDGNVKIKPSYGAIKEEDWIKKANAGNEEAMNFIFDHPKDYQEIITEWANNGIMKAVKSVYNHPHDFTDLIAKWAKEGDSEAADIVKNNPDIFL